MWNCKFPHVSTVMWPSPGLSGPKNVFMDWAARSLAYWSSSSQNAWTLLPQKLVMNTPTGSAVVRASG